MKLLLVEDDDRLRSMLERRLKGVGFAVLTSATAQDAWRALQRDRFDLVVLDSGLPDLDGTTLVRKLRGQHDATPVILLSGRSSWRDRVAGLDAGADDFVVKPVNLDALVARIRARLRRPTIDDDGLMVSEPHRLPGRTTRARKIAERPRAKSKNCC